MKTLKYLTPLVIMCHGHLMLGMQSQPPIIMGGKALTEKVLASNKANDFYKLFNLPSRGKTTQEVIFNNRIQLRDRSKELRKTLETYFYNHSMNRAEQQNAITACDLLRIFYWNVLTVEIRKDKRVMFDDIDTDANPQYKNRMQMALENINTLATQK